MTFKDFFDINGSFSKEQRTLNFTLRIFGIDFDCALYGYLNDWSFPLMILSPPQVRGLAVQVLFAALFIGRMREAEVPGVMSYDVPARNMFSEDEEEE